MKNLLNQNGVNVLSKSQQQSINGGRKYFCVCTGSVGVWEGNYTSVQEIYDAITKWCASGQGTCS